MDDDKREKLREYLRNNKSKNKINLNNSQISDNKTNLNKRDYDKEPIVLNNYEMIFAMLCDILSLIFALIIVIFFYAIFKGEISEILFTVNFIVIVAFVFICVNPHKNEKKILA